MNSEPSPQPELASKKWVLAFGVYLVILNLLLLYLLLRLWPGQVPLTAGPLRVKLIPGVWEPEVWTEVRFLALVALVGALGSYIHLATSFADYLGNRQFMKSWTWWYVLRPFIGSALAVAVYFAARGGLVSGAAPADLSLYGVSAIAGLTGMFSKQATDKLREVFETLFKTEKTPRADALKQPTDPGKPNS
ncbi:MAG TPA: hypothetical protein VKM93_21395 [Terriglobia bacterium]|nr:hypothetical protein [Terriglobia bacterium]